MSSDTQKRAYRHMMPKNQWPICTIGSCDIAGGQGPQNHYRKLMVSADSAAQSQLPFVIKKIDGKTCFMWLLYGGLYLTVSTI